MILLDDYIFEVSSFDACENYVFMVYFKTATRILTDSILMIFL